MQNVVIWNSFGFEDVAPSHFIFLVWLGCGCPVRADNKDFGLVTALQGSLPKQ